MQSLKRNNELSTKGNGWGLDPGLVLKIIFKRWYVFVISIGIALLGARFFIGHSLPVYQVSTSVLIYEADDRNTADNEELLQGMGLPGGVRSIDNQMMILTSRELTRRALAKLDLQMEYYYKTKRNNLPLYKNSPIELVISEKCALPMNVEFSVIYLGNDEYKMISEYDAYNHQATFGQKVDYGDGWFRIICNNTDWFIQNKDVTLCFVKYNTENLVRYFNNRLQVGVASRSGSVLELSLMGTNRARDVDFLNSLTDVFQDLSLEKKNAEADRQIQFINSQLVGITDSLVITENELQQFRSSRRVMNLSAQGQQLITQVSDLENERARLRLEANYYDYLSAYLENNEDGEVPLPVSMGLEDEALTTLVTELAELQAQLSSAGGGDKNPLRNLLTEQVKTKKQELLETLNGLKRANYLAKQENQSQIGRANAQASALPVTERQLLGIERKFRINDALYTFLLEKRSELQMQKASNRSDSEVVDPASIAFSQMVSPNPTMINFVALFLGSAIPMVILFILFSMNKRLREEDLSSLSTLPLLGSIPRIKGKKNMTVLDNPQSNIAEAYRLVRSKLQFVSKTQKSPVILISSAMPEDGKTTTAINLASVYSLLGKKTILIGFDLRNPQTETVFNIKKDKGVSTYLIGQHSLDEVIKTTDYPNLDIIGAGPVPPNPSELTASKATKTMFEQLKSRYDFIVVDSAPVALISDTHHLLPLADANVLVIRMGHTYRKAMAQAIGEIQTLGVDHLSLVVNETIEQHGKYGYGKKYQSYVSVKS
ncbi:MULTISPECIES: GumC family protein [unclassified Carboxylicivirga]|uniref:GumC family protein n=1 Tax=Carboxylicivirga TaxID=1628153 RepID=UPI003D330469